jgi:hypothetical protein
MTEPQETAPAQPIAAPQQGAAPEPGRLDGYRRALPAALAAVLLVVAAVQFVSFLTSDFGRTFGGGDLNGYLGGTRRWLETGSPYEAYQLQPGWALQPFSFLHPPLALLLFAPFLVLPAPLWWLVPIGATAGVIAYLRPARWTWPVMAFCLLWPRTAGMLVTGNTDLWVTAFVALGVVFRWPSALVLLKPSLFPLALIGVRDRRWWLTVGILAGVALLFGRLWLDYLTVIRGSPVEPTYSLLNLPLVGLPMVAWLGRSRRREASVA